MINNSVNYIILKFRKILKKIKKSQKIEKNKI